jgi:deoxycytidine triphosphate deaminase
MPTILSDAEIKKLLGTVIINGDLNNIRPNAYVLRLGAKGEFLNTGKEFDLTKDKKGLRIQPGHSVAVTAFETLDFRRETVHKIYPGHDLHAFVSPTTDLSREGIVAQTTAVDAGFYGTLNWTFANTSSVERRYIYKERIYRVTIFRLEEGETPEHLYKGDYQEQTGYVRSRRTGAPVGMKESEWDDGRIKGGPQDILEDLINSGYPWHGLGLRLKEIDLQLVSVTNEYALIHDSISKLSDDVNVIRERQTDTPNTVRNVLREEAGSLQNRWLIAAASTLAVFVGLGMTLFSSPFISQLVKSYGMFIGLGIIALAALALYLNSRRK